MSWQMIIYITLAAAGISLLGYGGWKAWGLLKKYLARPKKYFLRYLQDSHKEALQAAGVAFETGSAPDGAAGIIVKFDHLPQAMTALEAAHTASLMLNGKELHEAVLAFPHRNAGEQQSISVWHSTRDKTIAPRVRQTVHAVLAGRMNQRASVQLDSGHRYDDDGERNFRIVFGSAPRGNTKEQMPPRVFDIELSPQQARVYSVTGSPVTDPATGYIVGELNKGVLYIFADFWQLGEEQRYALLTRVLQRVLIERDPAQFLKEVIAEESEGVPEAPARQSIADEGFQEAGERAVVRATIHKFLSPYVKQEIHVKNCQGRTQRPLNDGMFHVFFGSAAAGRAAEEVPKKLLGCDLIRQDKAFGPTGLGIPLFEANGFIYAELVGSNLYIHQYLLTHASKAEAKLLARLFIKAGQLVEKQKSREGGPRFTEDDLREEAALIAASVKAGKNDKPVTEQELSKALRDAVLSDAEVFRLEHSGSEELGREFDELCRVYKVRSVEVKQKSIVIMTDMLYCVDPRSGKRHEIGEFKISIPMDNSSEVTWLNQTRTIQMDGRTMHAPHVSSRGKACFGNTQDLFPMLIKKREYASAVQLAIAFVESVNTSDAWGKGISRFPEAVGEV
jgi:hypothetical protein